MTKTQIVIFILVILGNGVMALWKKHKDRQAQQEDRDGRMAPKSYGMHAVGPPWDVIGGTSRSVGP